MNPTFSTVLAADFTGEHVSVDDVGALRARAEAAEADRARLNAANVRLMRRLAVALGSWRGNADLLVAMGRRAVAAEAALATARAEGAAAERAAVVACLHGGADAHSGFGRSVVAVALRDHVAYIEAGAHVRAVEGA